MESFSCTALHFITSVRQLHLIYKVSEAEGMWSINLRAGDYTRRESGCGGGEGGGIYHSPTWQDVLQLSLVELEWAIALIALIRDDLCQVCRESRREWRVQEGAFIPEPLCFLHRWGSSLTILPPFQKPVDTDGLYSPRALYEYHKACRVACKDCVCTR